MYLRLNLSTTPDLKLERKKNCTLLDPITGNFKASYVRIILDIFSPKGQADQDNRLPGKWGSIVQVKFSGNGLCYRQ